MKILIVGSRGMLGKELLNAFSNEEAVGWDKEEIDIADEGQTSEKIKKLKPNLIINAVAYNNVDGCEENFEFASKINGYAAGYLAKAANDLDIPFVHYSTGYVFDGEKGNYREDEEPNPISKYAKSKLLGEKEAQKYNNKTYIIRTNLLFGKQGGKMSKKSFIELMLDLAEKKDKLEVVADELSNPTYAKDLALATYELIEKEYPFGIYHFINNSAASWYDWAKEIFKIKNIDIKIEPVSSDKFSRAAARPKNSSLLNTKFPLLRDWKDALSEFLKLK